MTAFDLAKTRIDETEAMQRTWHCKRTRPSETGSDELRQKFTGHERDDRVGLDYMMARSCRMALGRFLEPDPYDGSARLELPQSWNRYAYVMNDPVNARDPDGYQEQEIMSNNSTRTGTANNGPLLLANNRIEKQADNAPKEPTSGEGSAANLARREAIAQTAEDHDGDTSMPSTSGSYTCNLVVQKVISEAGAPNPVVKKADGSTGAPGAAEWAGSPIPNWRILKPGETPKRGDVAAYKLPTCVDCTGHSGIVVSVSPKGRVGAIAAHETQIGPDSKFQPHVATYQRYTGN